MRSVMFLFLRLTGVPFLLRKLAQRNKVTILCYHDPEPAVVRRHFRLLTERYTVISLRDYIEWRQGRRREAPPPKALVVTFDDGHRNNFRLKELFEVYGIRPTIFLCSGIVDTHRHFWWTAVSNRAVREDLKTVPDGERLSRLAKLGYEQETEYPDRLALSRNEMEKMGHVVDFQSHTRFHPILPRCTADRAAGEIGGSKAELESRFGLPVYALAYPNGAYSDRDVELARDAGYQCGITTEAGYNNGRTDMFRLKRLGIYDKSDGNELIVRASGLWDFLRRCFGK